MGTVSGKLNTPDYYRTLGWNIKIFYLSILIRAVFEFHREIRDEIIFRIKGPSNFLLSAFIFFRHTRRLMGCDFLNSYTFDKFQQIESKLLFEPLIVVPNFRWGTFEISVKPWRKIWVELNEKQKFYTFVLSYNFIL